MKQLLALLFISLTLFSCSKSNDSDEEDDNGGGTGKTTVNFTNKLDTDLENVVLGSLKNGPATIIKKIGKLAAGASTGEIELTDKSINKVYFYCDLGTQVLMSPYGFSIAQGTFNNWQINGNIHFDPVKKTDEIYPK